jgi:glycosyltransferase involved in cell wall biosynthesis
VQAHDHPGAPIRVARIITRLNIGGPAIQAISLSDRLERRGFHTLLIHGRLGPGEGDMSYLIPPERSFEVRYVPALRRELAPANDVAALTQIGRLISEFQPAIVHTHMAKAGTIGRTAALLHNAATRRAHRARILHTYHGHVLDGYFRRSTARAFSAAERFLGRRSDALIAVSAIVRRDLLDAHRIGVPDRFHVVPLGFDLTTLAAIGPAERAASRARFGLDPDAHVAAMVGRLTAIKRPELFVRMAAAVTAHDPRAVFLIAGGGELEPELRSLTAGLGLTDRVRFLGWQRDLTGIYGSADVVVLTSRNEGTPVALIESMAAGVPGVCFAVGGVPDVVGSPDMGVLIPEGDVPALAAEVRNLLADAGRRAAMGARARVWVQQRFSIDRLVDDVCDLYRQLL